jgi:hypothetical protein
MLSMVNAMVHNSSLEALRDYYGRLHAQDHGCYNQYLIVRVQRYVYTVYAGEY